MEEEEENVVSRADLEKVSIALETDPEPGIHKYRNSVSDDANPQYLLRCYPGQSVLLHLLQFDENDPQALKVVFSLLAQWDPLELFYKPIHDDLDNEPKQDVDLYAYYRDTFIYFSENEEKLKEFVLRVRPDEKQS